jgi:uncharacterized protein (DUF2252 family)
MKKKASKRAETPTPSVQAKKPRRPELVSREACLLAGRALRERVPHESHAAWKPTAKGRDPIKLLELSSRGRVPELVPIRYGRMLRSPFTFLRGSAGVMAADLATLPTTKVRVQACGDCHLLNFGMFATPERNLVFDINDFDETLPAPWEWDLKRLAASIAVAARDNGHSDAKARNAAVACAESYREHLREYSKMSPLEVWYERLDEQKLETFAPDAEARERRKQFIAQARKRIGEYLLPKISGEVGGHRRLLDQPPVLFHPQEKGVLDRARAALEDYRLSLPDDRRTLFDRYTLQDIAVKVVGIGSVGTRCHVALFFSAENHALLLQFKEACPSVLAPYAGASVYQNQGQRIVVGQRLMQSSSDMFLGWTQGPLGFHYFGRQLRDMKFSPPIEGTTPKLLKRYAELCGWALARAHAKTGDAATISGYLGKTDSFAQAIGKFALAYADQTERDHAALKAAVKTGRIKALVEEDL